MSTQPLRPSRESYRHGDLRRALIDAAVALARELGPKGVTLREATRRAGVAPAAAYRHFENHQALVDEVRRVALAGLATRMLAQMKAASRGLQGAARARARFRALGRGYVLYALDEPGLFKTAFWAQPYDLDENVTASLVSAGLRDPFLVLRDALADLSRHGEMIHDKKETAALLSWAGVHGMALLILDGPIRAMDAKTKRGLIEGVTRMIDAGLRANYAPSRSVSEGSEQA